MSVLAQLRDAFAQAGIAPGADEIQAVIGKLPPKQRQHLARETALAAARESMIAYIDYLDVGIHPAAHHRLLIEALEAVERGECDRLMVNMPPGAAKSSYVSGLFPPWYLGRNPKNNVIAASYAEDSIEPWGRRARNHYASPLHRAVFGCGVASDSGAATRWNTEKGGEYYAVGIGGAITGRRADLGLIDDPVKGREEADSQRLRERAWEWYINDFSTRLKPGAGQVVVATRWHEDDLCGRIIAMEGDRWRVLKLPMAAGINDPLGRAPGERLWPDWFTEDMMADAKRNDRAWNALYQQEPAGEDGDYFKRDWFRQIPQGENFPPLSALSIYGASDYAVTEGSGDYTEHGIFGIDAQSNVYMMDWWRDQATADVWIEAKCDLIVKHKPLCWFGESGPIRRSIEPMLLKRMVERQAMCRLEWLPSIHDKPTRCRSFQALCSMGKVFLPPNFPVWKADVVGQLLRFPAGLHDDAVDVCSLIGRGLEHVRVPIVDYADRGGLPTRSNVGYANAKRHAHRR